MVEPAVMLVRFRSGVVGESRRLVHIASVPGNTGRPFLTVYCGHEFSPGEAELVDGPGGLPCLACLMKAPVPGLDDGLPAVDRPSLGEPG